MSVAPGDVLAGKYRVERVLGGGGMGIVVAATNLALKQTVALKFLLPGAIGGRETMGRFQREARTAARIKSEHVARVLDAGALEDESPFIVMEYLDGADLGDLLKQQGPFPVAEAVDYVLQACEALAEAHALGIVHRDVKPSNLFLTRQPSRPPIVKVLDFGISKSSSPDEDPNLTATQGFVGSPAYMSPEQVRSAKHVDHRTDVWSLGVTLYELLSSRAPFGAGGPSAVIARIVADTPEPLRKLRADVPEGLEAVVNRCLEKNVDRRYPSVVELSAALERFAPTTSSASVRRIADLAGAMPVISIPPPEPPAPAPPAPEQKTASSWEHRKAAQPGRSKWIAVAVAVGAIALAAALAGRFAGKRDAETAVTSVSLSAQASVAPRTAGPAVSAPASSAAPLRFTLRVEPADAVVTVDDASVQVDAGTLELAGEPGAVRSVVLEHAGQRQTQVVAITRAGLVPSLVAVPPGPDAAPRSAATPRSGASGPRVGGASGTATAPARTAPAGTAPAGTSGIDTNKGEFQ